MKRVALLAAVAGAHSAYYAVPEGDPARGWIAYVGSHALIVLAMLLLLPWAGSSGRAEWSALAGALACWWGALESAQAVGCALLSWGTLSNADLCEQAFGREVYALAAALAIAWVLAAAWRRRKGGGHG
jgi:hypothetical protein